MDREQAEMPPFSSHQLLECLVLASGLGKVCLAGEMRLWVTTHPSKLTHCCLPPGESFCVWRGMKFSQTLIHTVCDLLRILAAGWAWHLLLFLQQRSLAWKMWIIIF